MARHLYVAGVDRWPPANDQLDIEQVLTYQIDACSFHVAGDPPPAAGDEVIVEDDDIGRLFAGVVVKPELVDKDLKIWSAECDDYTELLDRKLVVETYSNMTADAIFKDIAAKYCPGFTLNGVQVGAPSVEYIVFDYIHPSECFKQLCDYVGWHWQPDYYKDLQFFSAENLASPAPLTLVPGGPFRFGKHTIDTQGLRNRVYVRGGTMLSDPQKVEWKADGVARTWVLPWGPHECSFEVGEVPVTMGIENVDEDDGTHDYFLNFQEKYIKCANATTTPAAGTTMSLTARQDIDVITMVEDLESQAAIAAVQGGDGVYEHSIPDDSLTTIQAAEAAGMADLREHANPKVSGSFETEVPGWRPGQLVDIQLPDRGVEGTYLVQKVSISPVAGMWTYSIQYGGRLLGIADFLKALVSAQQKKKLGETSILHKFQYGIDRAVVTDELESALREPPWVVEESREVEAISTEILPVAAAFTRASVAYKQDGSQVAAGEPRYEAGKFSNGIMIEEGTTILWSNGDFLLDSNTDGLADNWLINQTGQMFTLSTVGSYKKQRVRIPAGINSSTPGIYRDIVLAAGTYTISFYGNRLSSDRGMYFRAKDNGWIGTDVVSRANLILNSHQKYSFTFTLASQTTVRFFFLFDSSGTDNASSLEGIFEIDRFQLEAKPYATSFTGGTRAAETLTVPTVGVIADSSPWTISVWGKTNIGSGSYRMIFDAWSKFYVCINPDNKPQISWMDGTQKSAVASEVLANPLDWHFWSYTYDGTNSKLYVDGVKVIDVTTNLAVALPVNFRVASWDIYPWDGLVDDLRIDNIARTDAEILAMYNSGQPLPVDKYTTCKLDFDGTLIFPGELVTGIAEFETIGSMLSVSCSAPWPNPQYQTSEDGLIWTDWQDIAPNVGAIEVPYPGFVRLRADGKVKAYNWKKPLVESDTVCGFVVCG